MKDKDNISKIAYHIAHTHHYIFKLLWYLASFYYGGTLRAKYQNWFSKKIGFHPITLTLVNAIVFGIGGSLLYLISTKHIASAFSNLFALEINQFFHISFSKTLETYAIYGLFHNGFRVIYALITKKAIASISLFGAATNLFHYILILIHRDIFKKHHEFHGIKYPKTKNKR